MLARRVAATALKQFSRPTMVGKMAPRFSSLLDKKEKGEETRFIREEEAKRHREMVEKILAQEDSSVEKKELVELLAGKKEEPKGFLAKFGLDDPKIAAPVAFILGIPAIYNEVIVIDAELQITAVFLLICSLMYKHAGPMIGKSLDDQRKVVEDSLKSFDTNLQIEVRQSIAENENILTVTEDIKSVFALKDQLAIAQADVLNKAEEAKYREAIEKKLDALYAVEEQALSSIRNRMVSAVKTEVVDIFKNDKKAKENALNAAIAVLAAGEGGKLGKDIVGDVFASSLASYKENYAKQDPKQDGILVQLEKDIANIVTPPVVDAHAGGNVFVTHPI